MTLSSLFNIKCTVEEISFKCCFESHKSVNPVKMLLGILFQSPGAMTENAHWVMWGIYFPYISDRKKKPSDIRFFHVLDSH